MKKQVGKYLRVRGRAPEPGFTRVSDSRADATVSQHPAALQITRGGRTPRRASVQQTLALCKPWAYKNEDVVSLGLQDPTVQSKSL